MAYGIQDPIDLARLIMQMSYGGLTEVADALVKMNANEERDTKTINGMAGTLFDWAEAATCEADERAALDKTPKAA